MSRVPLLLIFGLLLPVPALAAPVAKKPPCQQVKDQRDNKRAEQCRETRQIPPIVDPIPLISLAALSISG